MAIRGKLPSRENIATSWGHTTMGNPGLLNELFRTIFGNKDFSINFSGEDLSKALGVIQGSERLKTEKSKLSKYWYKIAQQSTKRTYPAVLVSSDFDIILALDVAMANGSVANPIGFEKRLPIIKILPFSAFNSLSGIHEFNKNNNGFKATAIRDKEFKSLVEMGLVK